MAFMSSKFGQSIRFIVDANFHISGLFLLYCGFTAVTENFTVFNFDEELYGALHNNLRIALLYLAMSEAVIWIYCVVVQRPKLMGYVGCFLIMMLGSLTSYGKLNVVPIDPKLLWFFLYTGLSHVLFGVVSGMANITPKRILD